MKRLDLIISDLERTCSDPSCSESSIKALAAARELREVNQELLEALKNLCDQLPSNPIPLSTYFAKDKLLAARAALAKATGEQA